jgi:hypothetical protein
MLLALPREVIEDIERDIQEHRGNIDRILKVEVLNYLQKSLNFELSSNHSLLLIKKNSKRLTDTNTNYLIFLSLF